MEQSINRPLLQIFMVERSAGNGSAGGGGQGLAIGFSQEIQMSLATPAQAGLPLQAVVQIALSVEVKSANNEHAPKPLYSASYIAKFDYPASAKLEEVSQQLEWEEHGYLLAAQAFPLAMSHFRRELQAMGVDARQLPLGLAAG